MTCTLKYNSTSLVLAACTQEGVAGTDVYAEALSSVGGNVACAWGDALQAPRVAALCCAHQLVAVPGTARLGACVRFCITC